MIPNFKILKFEGTLGKWLFEYNVKIIMESLPKFEFVIFFYRKDDSQALQFYNYL
jgi:hypothetical protein